MCEVDLSAGDVDIDWAIGNHVEFAAPSDEDSDNSTGALDTWNDDSSSVATLDYDGGSDDDASSAEVDAASSHPAPSRAASWHHLNETRRLDAFFQSLQPALWAYCRVKPPKYDSKQCSVWDCSDPVQHHCLTCVALGERSAFCTLHGAPHAAMVGHHVVDSNDLHDEVDLTLTCCGGASGVGVLVNVLKPHCPLQVCRVLVCALHPSPAICLLESGYMVNDFNNPGFCTGNIMAGYTWY